MPFRYRPDTHAQRLNALQNAAEKWNATPDPAERLITPDQFAAIDYNK